MIRRAFFTLNALCAAGLVGMVALRAAPAIETFVAPLRVNNINHDLARSADRFCWIWSSDKLRPADSDNVDVFLDLLDAAGRTRKTYDPPLKRRDTGMPWQSGGIVGVGHHDLPYCIELPPTVTPADRIRVRFKPVFHGWFGLWEVPITTPDMLDPPP